MIRVSREKLIFARSLVFTITLAKTESEQSPKIGLSPWYREWYGWYRVNWFVRGEINGLPDESLEAQSTPVESDITPRQYYNCAWRRSRPLQLLRLSFAAAKIYGTVDAPRRSEVEGRRPGRTRQLHAIRVIVKRNERRARACRCFPMRGTSSSAR